MPKIKTKRTVKTKRTLTTKRSMHKGKADKEELSGSSWTVALKSSKVGKKSKSLDELSYAELQVLAKQHPGVKANWKKARLKRALKKQLAEPKLEKTSSKVTSGGSLIDSSSDPQKDITSASKKVTSPVPKMSGESHTVKPDIPLVDSALVTFPKRWVDAEKSFLKNKEKLKEARAKGLKPIGTKKGGYPASWDEQEQLAQQLIENRKILAEYQKKDLIPFYSAIEAGSAQSRVSNDLIPLSAFQKLPHVDIIAEKTTKGYLTDEQLKKSVLTAGGNNIQASIDNNMRFQGLYFQDGSQEKPLPHFAKFDQIIVDADDTGAYTAYFTNYYVNGDPFKENVWINRDGKQTKLALKTKAQKQAFELQAMRFFAGQIIDSSAYRRNLAVQDAIKKDLETALTYRTATGETKDVKISEQKLAMCDYILVEDVFIDVVTPEATITFPFALKDLPEGSEPILEFKYNEKFEPLNSDDLLEISTERFGLEPDSAQAILENLYHSGWINYPRADMLKAEDEPIHLLRPYVEFQGTVQEKQILKVIHEAETSNYIKKGMWQLKLGDESIAETRGRVYGFEPMRYTSEQFDIKVRRGGITPSLLIKYLNDNHVSTPATRTAQLAELKQAGIITLVDKHYILDKRGISFVAGYEFYREHSFDAIDLKRRVKKVKSVKELHPILKEIKPMSRSQTRRVIAEKAKTLIEAQNDLAELEAF